MLVHLLLRRSTRARATPLAPVVVTILTLACASPAAAQKVTIVPDLTARQVLVQLGDPLSSRPVGEAIALTSAVEIATMPFGTSSGGFVFKLDPSTGLLARTTTTFGPSFTERALTMGEGQVSVGATFNSTSYDELSGFSLSNLPLGSITATSPAASRTSTANLNLTARTVAMSGTVGVSENVDVGVVVPLMSIKLSGTSSVIDGNGTLARLAETNTTFAGIGDVAAFAKYRFVKFKGPELPDPGGIALLVNMRLPTGSRDNLRGLGITRTLVSGVVSGGRKRLRPHASAGFEYWSKNVNAPGNPGETVSVRHQVQYAAGVEMEAAPKVTLLVDYLGQHIMRGGEVGLVTDTFGANPSGITSTESLVALGRGINKGLLIPGLKVNLKGKMLLSLNVIVTMKNNGLRATVTPVAGINLTM
jgi:hypothetical protein